MPSPSISSSKWVNVKIHGLLSVGIFSGAIWYSGAKLCQFVFPSGQDYYSRTALKGALDDIRPNKSFFGFHPHGCLVSKESVGMLGRGCQEATCREITSSWALGGAKKLPCRFPNTVPSCTIYLMNLKGLRFYLLYLRTRILTIFFLCKS